MKYTAAKYTFLFMVAMTFLFFGIIPGVIFGLIVFFGLAHNKVTEKREALEAAETARLNMIEEKRKQELSAAQSYWFLNGLSDERINELSKAW